MMQKLNNQDFDHVYELMERSFPPNERRTYAEQKALLDNPSYCIYVLPNADSNASSKLKAFLAVWTFDDFVFIEHFAVNPLYRNSGIGSDMLQEAFSQMSNMICLEVEPPEQEIAQRRIRFYERNGFFLNRYPYVQPSITSGQTPIPLFLMTSGGQISAKQFEKIKNELYEKVYHVSIE